MTGKIFTGNFTQQEPIPEDAINSAIEVMRSGRLHRYNVAEGEVSETALLEIEFGRGPGAVDQHRQYTYTIDVVAA